MVPAVQTNRLFSGAAGNARPHRSRDGIPPSPPARMTYSHVFVSLNDLTDCESPAAQEMARVEALPTGAPRLVRDWR